MWSERFWRWCIVVVMEVWLLRYLGDEVLIDVGR